MSPILIGCGLHRLTLSEKQVMEKKKPKEEKKEKKKKRKSEA